MRHRAILAVPLALLLLFGAIVAWRLANPPDTVIRSKLEGRPLPEFALPAAVPGRPGLSTGDFRQGGPRLLNVFASWCVPCIAEAPMLMELKRRGAPIEAIAIRDRPEDIADFLKRHGDPFGRIGADADSRVQLALGSAGVPETFVVDGQGVIRFQHVGPIMADDVTLILSELEKAR
jgi:cytochrome c biogenesis protein CcmG/thiol:disulfide interchange protein DsbE